MNAIDKARELYEHDGKDFDKVMAGHLQHGIVFSSPLWFMMVQGVKLDNGEKAWFIECASGKVKDLSRLVVSCLPPAPFMAFSRMKNGKRKIKVYRSNRILALAQGYQAIS